MACSYRPFGLARGESLAVILQSTRYATARRRGSSNQIRLALVGSIGLRQGAADVLCGVGPLYFHFAPPASEEKINRTLTKLWRGNTTELHQSKSECFPPRQGID